MGRVAAERATRQALASTVAGSGPPLILLHGLSGSGRWWSRNTPALSACFRTYTVDLPGFGASRAARWSRLDDIADRLVGWMDDEQVTRASIAGHSLGGAVAARLAARHPDRVERLVLVGAAVPPLGFTDASRAVNLWRAMIGGAPGLVSLTAHDLLRCHPGSFIAAAIDTLATNWDHHLARITAPTLVVWGERDPIVPVAVGRRIVGTVPNARLLTVPNTGHSPMWEDAESFNAEVLRFLSEDDGGKTTPGPDLGDRT